MKYFVRFLLLVVLVAIAFWAWLVLFPSPKQVIQGRLLKLAHLASFPSREGNIVRIANVEKMGNLFSDDAEAVIDVPGIESHTFTRREELMQAAIMARGALNGLKVDFVDTNIEVGPDQQSAIADLTLRAQVSGEKDLIVQELKFTFKKLNNAWLITHIETVKTLRQ
ncbi:MAG: hypothetical protein JWR19_2253 [Pedosphaera sp.]|nr:hypothetical protein [Pedosphaera sp.]